MELEIDLVSCSGSALAISAADASATEATASRAERAAQ